VEVLVKPKRQSMLRRTEQQWATEVGSSFSREWAELGIVATRDRQAAPRLD
jgi:hypothetical protein